MIEGDPRIVGLASAPGHSFSKHAGDRLNLIAGMGAAGDAHAGKTVQHLSRVARDPAQPNLRQVHLLHAELFDELADAGFALTPGLIGENVATRGVDLLALPAGTRLHLGSSAVVEVTGLRNPCVQLNRLMPGLMEAVLERQSDGTLIRKAGIMAIVLQSGLIVIGDQIRVELPDVHLPLQPV